MSRINPILIRMENSDFKIITLFAHICRFCSFLFKALEMAEGIEIAYRAKNTAIHRIPAKNQQNDFDEQK